MYFVSVDILVVSLPASRDFAIVDDDEWHPLDEILEGAFPTLWLFLNVPERGEHLAARWNVHEMIVEVWLPRLVREGRVSVDVAKLY